MTTTYLQAGTKGILLLESLAHLILEQLALIIHKC